MEIDRRNLLTGMAATGASLCQGFHLRQGFGGHVGGQAAAMLPALPPFAVGAARRFYFPRPLLFSLSTPWSLPAFVAQYGARWRFDPNPKGRPLIKHEDSGLTFHRRPQQGDPFVMEAAFFDGPLDGMPDAESMAAIGRAAVWTFVHGQNLRYDRRREGAIYFQYGKDGERGCGQPYVVEDAPALV